MNEKLGLEIIKEINQSIIYFSKIKDSFYLNENSMIINVKKIKIIKGKDNLLTELYFNHSCLLKINEKGYLVYVNQISKILYAFDYIKEFLKFENTLLKKQVLTLFNNNLIAI